MFLFDSILFFLSFATIKPTTSLFCCLVSISDDLAKRFGQSRQVSEAVHDFRVDETLDLLPIEPPLEKDLHV